jgi:hypothetical protein
MTLAVRTRDRCATRLWASRLPSVPQAQARQWCITHDPFDVIYDLCSCPSLYGHRCIFLYFRYAPSGQCAAIIDCSSLTVPMPPPHNDALGLSSPLTTLDNDSAKYCA